VCCSRWQLHSWLTLEEIRNARPDCWFTYKIWLSTANTLGICVLGSDNLKRPYVCLCKRALHYRILHLARKPLISWGSYVALPQRWYSVHICIAKEPFRPHFVGYLIHSRHIISWTKLGNPKCAYSVLLIFTSPVCGLLESARSSEKPAKNIVEIELFCGQARVRTIDKLDKACTNADDRKMLVRHRSGDHVMSY